MHWRRKWQPTPVFLPGESHRLRSLIGCSPWGGKESDMTEQLHFTHLKSLKMMIVAMKIKRHLLLGRKVKVKLLSHVRLFATPWTIAHQAPPSMGFSRQEYWSGLPFPSPTQGSNLCLLPLAGGLFTAEPPGKPYVLLAQTHPFMDVLSLCTERDWMSSSREH